MRALMTQGRAVTYDTSLEQPREAIGCCDAFKRSTGMYTFEVEDEYCEFTFLPTRSGRDTNRAIGVAVRGLSADRSGTWARDDQNNSDTPDGRVQRLPNA